MNTLNYIGDNLGHFGFLAWVLLIGALAGAIWKFKSTRGRAIAIACILGLFAAFPGRWAWEVQQRVDHYRTAEAMFQERCKKSGEFIHRTVEDIEGVFLMKVRTTAHMGDQWALDDQYGDDLKGDGYIGTFLRARNEKGFLDAMKAGGYRYVEAIDPKDGKRYRYTGSVKAVGRMDTNAPNVQNDLKRNPSYDLNIYCFVLDKTSALDPAPRYGVTYDDISTREEREYWIAGSSLKVIDLQANEVVAERIGYMMDPGQGANGAGRTPWLFAADNACPAFGPKKVGVPRSFYQSHQTRNFVEKTLHLPQGK